MPLKISKVDVEVKDPNSGQMIPAGLLGSDALDVIEQKKNQAVTEIEQKGTQTKESIPNDYSALAKEVSELRESIQQGLSEDAIAALLACFEHVAWSDGNGQEYYHALHAALTVRSLTSIDAAFTQGQAVIYDTDSLNSLKQYLTVTAHYSDSSSEVVSDYILSGTLKAGTSTITVSYSNKTDTFNVVVTHKAETYSVTSTLTHCTSNNAATAIEKGGSYNATLSANAGYTMTGANVRVLMNGTDVTESAYRNQTITISSVTGDLLITATAAAIVLESISSVFTQGQTVVYSTDSLDTLKSMLVVTAHYSDGSTSIVPDSSYTLSGTLAAGTSTITVSYSDKTSTFDVVVSASEFPISSYEPFEIGFGYYAYDKNDKIYWEIGTDYVKGASAKLLNGPLIGGDTITLPDYTNFKFTLSKPDTNAETGFSYIAADQRQDYTLSSTDASEVGSIIVAHVNSDPLTTEELAWINSNAKVRRG